MDYFRSILENNKKTIIFLLGAIVLELVIFKILFGFHPNNDTDSFISISEFFRGNEALIFPNRYLNPFYPVVSATLLAWLSPAMSIVVTNIVLFFGVVLLTYGLLRRVFNPTVGLLSALIIMTAYPVIRYGLTQVQDMGGYFWFVATLYAGWRWRETKLLGWLLVGSCAVAFGLLTKESGAMGALFVGVLILVSQLTWIKKIAMIGLFSVAPFITLVINQWRGREINYNSGQWFIENWHTYAPTNYTLFKWFGVNATTYNVLWVAIGIGFAFLIKNWRTLTIDSKVYLLAVLVPSFSYLTWPIFIGRTVFISAWLFVPIAAYGLQQLFSKQGWQKLVGITLFCLILTAPTALQQTLRYAHVFAIIEQCHNSIGCSWDTFWRERNTISTQL